MHDNSSPFSPLLQSARGILLSALALFTTLFALTYVATLLAVPASAQTTETESNDATAAAESAPDSETTRNLRERIESVVQERQAQIQGVIDRISEERRGFIGQIERITEDSITIRTQSGLEIIPLDEDVRVVDESDDSVAVDDIVVGSWATVIGAIENSNFQPLRVTVREESPRPNDHQLSVGTIDELSRNELVLSPRGDEGALRLVIDSDTSFEDIDGAALQRSAITAGTQAVVLSFETDASSATASIVRVLTTAEGLDGSDTAATAE